MTVQLKGTEIRTIKNVFVFFSIWAISDNVKIASTVVGEGGVCGRVEWGDDRVGAARSR